jgi:hypothetical protein
MSNRCELEKVLNSLSAHWAYFYNHPLPPCQAVMKWYEHAILKHMLPQMSRLSAKGMSLAACSSKFLEALNKTLKAIMRKLTGGDWRNDRRQDADPNTRLPVVQGFVKLCAKLRFMRLGLFKDYAKMSEVDKLISAIER